MLVSTFQKTVSLQTTFESVFEDLHYCDTQKIEVACFPECYLTGYFLELEEIKEHALSLGASKFQTFMGACSSFKATFILGLIEKADEGFYNTAAVISKGKLLGIYRKTHPNEKHFLPGRDFSVFQRHGVNFGINICNDANYPNAALALANQGARVLFFPLNNMLPKTSADAWRTKSPENLNLRARETNCWVVSSDVVGAKDDWLSYGCTQIVSPAGKVVGAVPEGQEGCAVFELDF